MFLQLLKMVAQSIASHFKPTERDPQKSIKVFILLRKWRWIAFCLENPLSQIAILVGMSTFFYFFYFCQSCINLGQFVCHSELLPRMHQASNIVLFSHSCRSVSINSRSSPLHMSLLLHYIEKSTISF
jgi:hypothetical protein